VLVLEADEAYRVTIGAGVGLTGGRVEVMGELRLRSEAPPVMIDVYSSAAQFALEAGADQWLVKPFVPGALVGSELRRATNSALPAAMKVEFRGMNLDGG
jgi:DNA-binding response OmpR family regulator